MPNQTFSEELYDDKALKDAVDSMANLIKTHATKSFVNSAMEQKQDILTFDSTPTASSTNPVTSGGIKTALDAVDIDISSLNEDITNLSESVGDLKSALNVVSDLNYPDKTVNYGLFNDQEIQYWNQTAQRIIRIECDGNTKYTISKTLGDSFKIGCTASVPAVDVAILGYYSHSANTGTVEYTTPESAQYLLIHCAIQPSPATNEQLLADVTIFTITGGKDNVARDEINVISQGVEELDGDVSDLTDDVSSMKAAITVEQYIIGETETNIDPIFTVGYMNTSGTVDDSGSSAYFNYTQKISVQTGDKVSAIFNGRAYDMRFVCAFNGDTVVSASGWDNSGNAVTPYTVPAGIDGVVVSVRVSYHINKIKVTHTESKESAYIKPTPMGYMTEQGVLSPGGVMSLPFHNVKNANVYIFNANIDTFGTVKFLKENDFYVEVDATNLYITNGTTTYTVPHGLSISHNITLMICNETAASVSLIRVSSDGQEFNYTTATRFLMDSGTPQIQSVGSALNECTFSWISKNVNAPIWLFGDSYFSWYNSRWTYYLARDGYTKDCLLNGYAGEASAAAFNALKNLLAITKPKTVVWCMGMNDGDSSTAVNANWKLYYDRLVNLSKEYGFEIVLYTVPTTPVINNAFKNTIIRNSGYRYIEADLAVRIDDDGNWIPGALNEGTVENPDNVHPTEMGAKIIYHRVLADLPEIMCNF